MVTIANIASRMKDETGYTDPSDTNLEYLIDNVIDEVNLMAGTSIADLAGAAPNKSITASEGELVAVKAGVNLALRAYHDKGPNTAIATLNVTEITTDPHYKIMTRIWNRAINYLRGRSFERT